MATQPTINLTPESLAEVSRISDPVERAALQAAIDAKNEATNQPPVVKPPTYKISIACNNDVVIFQASSPISESRTANYDGLNIVHLPTDIWTYRNTSSRHFQVQGKLVSRNLIEATANSRYVDLIRSWVLPDFAKSGATPPIVKLSAFYNTNINNVPCFIRTYSITYPDDVDWIYESADPIKGPSAMPIICTISVDLEEAYSASQITNRAWKIKSLTTAPKGDFITGRSINDVSSAGGGQSLTPSVMDLTGSTGFTGLADVNVPSANATPVLYGNGDLTSIFGTQSSNLITDTTAKVSNPQSTGYSLDDLASQLTTPAPQVSPPTPAAVSNSFGKGSPYINNPPITS